MAQTKNQSRKSNYLYLVILFLIISVVLLVGAFYFRSWIVLDRMSIPVALQISDHAAFKVENTSLDFGTIPYSSAAQKSINLANNYDFPVKVYFECIGQACDFLNFEGVVTLIPYEERKVVFSTIEFSNEPYGQYSGEMKVTFVRDII
ncbi:MAG TPA: hypothetical protein VJH92_03825 [Candidatus Nanoarchaeia archaeon]|nr:hypothetical protein [Candidatus Nanoarchaeia archaeon]